MSLNGKSILVTGGTGQLGSFLVERLVKDKAYVTVLGRNPGRHESLAKLIKSGKVLFLKCDLADIRNIEKIGKQIADTEYLAHLSSAMEPVYPGFYENARHDIALNVRGTVSLMRHMGNLNGISFASSMAVYGAPAYNPVDEKCPAEPLNSYGVCKLTVEKLLQIYSKRENIPLAILRYSSIYGPRNMSTRALPTFIKNALRGNDLVIKGDGKTARDYVFVDDAVDATLSALGHKKGGIFNIGYGKGCSIESLAKAIVKVSGSKSRIRKAPSPKDFDFIFDISRARKELRFSPKTGLEQGLNKEIEWHRKHLPRQ